MVEEVHGTVSVLYGGRAGALAVPVQYPYLVRTLGVQLV